MRDVLPNHKEKGYYNGIQCIWYVVSVVRLQDLQSRGINPAKINADFTMTRTGVVFSKQTQVMIWETYYRRHSTSVCLREIDVCPLVAALQSSLAGKIISNKANWLLFVRLIKPVSVKVRPPRLSLKDKIWPWVNPRHPQQLQYCHVC